MRLRHIACTVTEIQRSKRLRIDKTLANDACPVMPAARLNQILLLIWFRFVAKSAKSELTSASVRFKID
jgi:hypothetical protein